MQPTNKQSDKQTNERTDKPTNEQKKLRRKKLTNKHTNKQTNKQTKRQTNRKTDKSTYEQKNKQIQGAGEKTRSVTVSLNWTVGFIRLLGNEKFVSMFWLQKLPCPNHTRPSTLDWNQSTSFSLQLGPNVSKKDSTEYWERERKYSMGNNQLLVSESVGAGSFFDNKPISLVTCLKMT